METGKIYNVRHNTLHTVLLSREMVEIAQVEGMV